MVEVYRQGKEKRLKDVADFVLSIQMGIEINSQEVHRSEYNRLINSMGETVGEMSDAELLQQIAKVNDFTKSSSLGEQWSGGVLKGLQEYAWRRGLVPERPDWSVELNR